MLVLARNKQGGGNPCRAYCIIKYYRPLSHELKAPPGFHAERSMSSQRSSIKTHSHKVAILRDRTLIGARSTQPSRSAARNEVHGESPACTLQLQRVGYEKWPPKTMPFHRRAKVSIEGTNPDYVCGMVTRERSQCDRGAQR